MDLLRHLQGRPQDDILAETPSGPMTVGAFLTEAARWSRAFRRAGEPRAVLFAECRTRFAAAMLGAWAAGVRTILPTDMTAYTQEKLKGAGTLFVFNAGAGFEPTAEDSPEEGDVLRLALPMEAELAELFTSGSTGEPTRIVKRLDRVLDAIDQLDRDFPEPFPSDALVWSTVSHQHIYGYLWALLWPLARGMRITDERLMFPETIEAALASSPNAILITSPAHLKRLPEMLDWSKARGNLLGLVSSGGPLPVDGLQLSHRIFGKTPFEILGSTELDGIAWRQRKVLDAAEGEDPVDPVDPVSARWRPMPDTEIRADEDGVLAVRSPRLDPAQWFRGDDRIRFDADGRFELLGRVDRIAKIEEKRVSLTALEAEAVASGLLETAKAFQLPDDAKTLALVGVPTDAGRRMLETEGKLALVRALKAKLNARFEKVVQPRRWRFEPVMPADARGKCTIEGMTALFDERRFEPVAWTTGHNRLEMVFEIGRENIHFKGHFPEFAILPGVAQLHLAVVTAQRYLGVPAAVRSVTKLKFTAMVLPGARVRLALAFNPEARTLDFTITDDRNADVTYSSGKLAVGDDGADQ